MTTRSTKTAIVYPDSDGMPLPDGEYQTPLYVKVVSATQNLFQEHPWLKG